MLTPFDDRRHAGRVTAQALSGYRGRQNGIVLALPRGGVPVGYEVARALGLPLDVFIVRKLGFPGHEEFAMGAIASGGVRFLNPDVVGKIAEDDAIFEQAEARERRELERREAAFRSGRAPLLLANKCVILVDDGFATGSTMQAALTAVRMRQPERVVVAVPVASREACADVSRRADDVVCGMTPEAFTSVGEWYRDFEQTTDEEVKTLLAQAQRDRRASVSGVDSAGWASRHG